MSLPLSLCVCVCARARETNNEQDATNEESPTSSLVLNWVHATALINAARQVHSAHCGVRPRVPQALIKAQSA